ncbi:MAG: 1-acyl-sn-glycerol-3-phosphate acyltransferase [Gammaproteobacteria bacterium]|nr:1-acyl-sn-glycerol-3-phosphate acyltransferase [Gammaproteobacteria bacterium]
MTWIKKIENFIVILRSFFIVGWYSSKIILLAKLNRLTQRHITCYKHIASIKLLAITKTKYSLQQSNTSSHSNNWDNNRPYIYMSNHISLYDPVLIHATIPGYISMVAKNALFKVPFFGAAMRLSHFISIDRSNGGNNLEEFEKAKSLLKMGVRFWVFAEGSRSKTGGLLPLKAGGFRLALEADALIVPVAIIGTEQILPAKTSQIFLNKTIKIKIGEPIDTRHYGPAQQKSLIDLVAQQITSLSGANA